MTNYQKMYNEFLLIKDKLGDDKIFFHLEGLVGDQVKLYDMDIMAMLALNTYTGFTDLEVEKNKTNGARCRLMSIRLSDMCEDAIERLQGIQIKLKEISDASREEKAKTTVEFRRAKQEYDETIDLGTSKEI